MTKSDQSDSCNQNASALISLSTACLHGGRQASGAAARRCKTHSFIDLSGFRMIRRLHCATTAFAAYPHSLRSLRYSTVRGSLRSASVHLSIAGRQRKTVGGEG